MNVLDSIPKYLPNQITYRRLEPNGFLVFRTKKHPELNEMLFNVSSQVMLNMCDGEKTIKEIMSRLLQKYDAEETLIFKDLYDLLFNCWRMGLIEWININPYESVYKEKKNEFVYSMLTEEEAVQKVAGKEFGYINPYAKKEWDYSETFVRQYSFRYQESYFALERDGKSILLVSLASTFNNADFLTIGLLEIYEIEDVSKDVIKSFLDWCSSTIAKHTSRKMKFSSIVMYALEEFGCGSFESILKDVFELQGVCRAEFNGEHSDVYVYQLLI